MLSKERAREIARAECERRGWPWTEPVKVTRGPFRITVWTNSGKVDSNVRIVLGARTGQVRHAAFMHR